MRYIKLLLGIKPWNALHKITHYLELYMKSFTMLQEQAECGTNPSRTQAAFGETQEHSLHR